MNNPKIPLNIQNLIFMWFKLPILNFYQNIAFIFYFDRIKIKNTQYILENLRNTSGFPVYCRLSYISVCRHTGFRYPHIFIECWAGRKRLSALNQLENSEKKRLKSFYSRNERKLKKGKAGSGITGGRLCYSYCDFYTYSYFCFYRVWTSTPSLFQTKKAKS